MKNKATSARLRAATAGTALAVLALPAAKAACVDTSRDIVFANGMFNTLQDAQLSLIALKQALDPALQAGRVGPGPFNYDIAYNQNERAHTQFLEAARQNVGGTFSLFWRYWANRLAPPPWVQETARFLARQANNTNYLLDADLQQHVARYAASIRLGRQVLVVSHSQGNFYSNEARTRLAADPTVTVGSYGVVGVATPAAFVATGGPYTTLADDQIINAVRAVNPFTLPANTNNPPGTSRDAQNHSFVDAYMRPATTSRPQIVEQSVAVLGSLQAPQCP